MNCGKKNRANEVQGDSVLSDTINYLLELSGIKEVVVNTRILHTFRKKLYCLQKAYIHESQQSWRKICNEASSEMGKWRTLQIQVIL